MRIRHSLSLSARGMSRRKVVVLAVVVIVLVAGGILARHIFFPDPREKFRAELNQDFDKLVVALKEIDHENVEKQSEAVTTSYQDGVPRIGQGVMLPMPRTWTAIHLAEQVQNRFSAVPLSMLLENPKGFDRWAKRMRTDHDRQVRRVREQVRRIEADYKEHPDAYVSKLYGYTVRTSPDGRTVFVQGSDGYLIDVMVDIDLEGWLSELKKHIPQLP